QNCRRGAAHRSTGRRRSLRDSNPRPNRRRFVSWATSASPQGPLPLAVFGWVLSCDSEIRRRLVPVDSVDQEFRGLPGMPVDEPPAVQGPNLLQAVPPVIVEEVVEKPRTRVVRLVDDDHVDPALGQIVAKLLETIRLNRKVTAGHHDRSLEARVPEEPPVRI